MNKLIHYAIITLVVVTLLPAVALSAINFDKGTVLYEGVSVSDSDLSEYVTLPEYDSINYIIVNGETLEAHEYTILGDDRIEISQDVIFPGWLFTISYETTVDHGAASTIVDLLPMVAILSLVGVLGLAVLNREE